MVTGSIEHKIHNLVHEALPRVTKCVYDEQRMQIKREKMIAGLTKLFITLETNVKHGITDRPTEGIR